MRTYLDFEKPIAELEGKVAELRSLADEDDSVSIDDDVERLERKAEDALKDIYKSLNPWQKTQVARHPQRPHMMAYVNRLIKDFTILSGDRKFADDHAIVGGIGRFRASRW